MTRSTLAWPCHADLGVAMSGTRHKPSPMHVQCQRSLGALVSNRDSVADALHPQVKHTADTKTHSGERLVSAKRARHQRHCVNKSPETYVMSPFSPPDTRALLAASYRMHMLAPPFGCAIPDMTSHDRGGASMSDRKHRRQRRKHGIHCNGLGATVGPERKHRRTVNAQGMPAADSVCSPLRKRARGVDGQSRV